VTTRWSPSPWAGRILCRPQAERDARIPHQERAGPWRLLPCLIVQKVSGVCTFSGMAPGGAPERSGESSGCTRLRGSLQYGPAPGCSACVWSPSSGWRCPPPASYWQEPEPGPDGAELARRGQQARATRRHLPAELAPGPRPGDGGPARGLGAHRPARSMLFITCRGTSRSRDSRNRARIRLTSGRSRRGNNFNDLRRVPAPPRRPGGGARHGRPVGAPTHRTWMGTGGRRIGHRCSVGLHPGILPAERTDR